jgi:hypothetical protein
MTRVSKRLLPSGVCLEIAITSAEPGRCWEKQVSRPLDRYQVNLMRLRAGGKEWDDIRKLVRPKMSRQAFRHWLKRQGLLDAAPTRGEDPKDSHDLHYVPDALAPRLRRKY